MWVIVLLFGLLVPRPAVPVDAPAAWALINLGGIHTSEGAEQFTSSVESMIKPWLAADYLRRTTDPPPWRLAELSAMIVHSDDSAAEDIYRTNGTDASIRRMITTCSLRHTTIRHAWWSYTTMTATDAALLGLCLADGRAAAQHTGWLLGQMRAVTGTVAQQQATTGGGRWGIIDGLPAQLQPLTAIKNGWTRHGEVWSVNCLAIGPGFVLAVMMRYPASHDLAYGAAACAELTRSLYTRAAVRFQ